MTLLIDNEFESSLEDFIAENQKEDVAEIMTSEIELLNSLQVGMKCFIGMCEIERIA